MSYIIYVVLSIVILLHAFVVDSQLKLFYNIRKGSAFPVTIYKSCIKHCSAEPRNEDGEDDELWKGMVTVGESNKRAKTMS